MYLLLLLFILILGKHLLRRLVAAGIDCSYHLLSSVYVALSSVTKVIMGAHALLNNGAVYSRVGTSMVAMAASDKQVIMIKLFYIKKKDNGS